MTPVALVAAVAVTLIVVADDKAPNSHTHPHHHLADEFVPAATTTALPLPRTGWSVTVDNAAPGTASAAEKAIDGDAATAWRTSDGLPLPHRMAIDLRDRVALSGLTYLPPATLANGRIGQYRVDVSEDGQFWQEGIASGTFADDSTQKTISFPSVITRHLRLIALTEAGNRGPWTAAAEINVLGGTDPILPATGWTATDSQGGTAVATAPGNAFDGDTDTTWTATRSGAPIPSSTISLTVDMRTDALVSGLDYLPRQQDTEGRIHRYRIDTSADGLNWDAATAGEFTDATSAQTARFAPTLARFVRLSAQADDGTSGSWTAAAAEISLVGRPDPTLPRAGWTAAASSSETAFRSHGAGAALDGNPATFWHSRWSSDPDDRLPHTLTITTPAAVPIGGLVYLPRPGTSPNGRIGRYRIEVSIDGTTWTTAVDARNFTDNAARKTIVFPATAARYIRLVGLSEAGSRGPWSSSAEINLLGPSGSTAAAQGSWAAPVGFPLVPVAAAVLPSGKILTWSAFKVDEFAGGTGKTLTATFDPATRIVTQRAVSDTRHDMFCPGISILADGNILVSGGNDSSATSLYNPATDAWTIGPKMTTSRGYQSNVTLSDNRVFAIGGSWSGGIGGANGTPRKGGEVWSAATGWKALPDASVIPMLTNDANTNGDYRKDNHGWLFAWSKGTIFQAGPSAAMNWYTTEGTGGVTPAGRRGEDTDAMNGNAVMYDAGKILTLGGSPSYTRTQATPNAHVITLNGQSASVRKVSPMKYPRAFANSVVLPDGKVAVFGGQSYPVPFSDNAAILAPEVWDPETERFTTMASPATPRTYHSLALLMPDGRVFAAGGGLCGTCKVNHFDGEIFTPPNLLKADGTLAPRPAITAAPTAARHGDTITVATNRPVASFSIVRFGSATHSVNTDQRRIALKPTRTTSGYKLTIPADPGVAVPGPYMLFAIDDQGVPSVSTTIRIG